MTYGYSLDAYGYRPLDRRDLDAAELGDVLPHALEARGVPGARLPHEGELFEQQLGHGDLVVEREEDALLQAGG